MSAIQNLKNFIRHGKQARATNPPHGDPTTIISPVHAHPQQRQVQPEEHHVINEPYVDPKAQHDGTLPVGDYPVTNVDNRNVAAQAGGNATRVVGDGQRLDKAAKNYDNAVLERIVAEEREIKGKLPKYPGLERWVLLEKMGDGAFSNVYRARDGTGELGEVAIKVVRKYEMNSSQGVNHLHPDVKKQPKTVERTNILKEVQIMRQLDHPGIVKLIDFSESRQFYYIVLELCSGGELFHQIVRLTYFSENLSRHVITQVARSLEYLHEERGVVHRDIKPENLLFEPIPFIPTKNPKPRAPGDEDKVDEGEFIPGIGSGGIGRVKIADFGLSKVVWDSQTTTPCGTVGYTAPEIVKDERYSKSVDMWALGCVLYTLLCGFPPFYDESIQVLTEKVARGQYTFLSPWWDDISKSAQDLVSHLLTVDPEKRYTIKEFMRHPWIRETDEETTPAADAPPLATPALYRENQLGATPMDVVAGFTPLPTHIVETPGRPIDFRSPGAINLREVFDVGYAVHRQEEEAKRRKNFGQGYRGGAGGMASLNVLNEADDGYDDGDDENIPHGIHPPPQAKLPKARDADVRQVEQSLKQTYLGNPSAAAQARQAASLPHSQQRGQHNASVAATAKQQARRNPGAFELSLNNATLLGRRGKRQHPDSSQLVERVIT
ncbi:hypothetical protein GP486_007351 [Trichoglossum hirsutum]|uniref:Protein kinase domain-containing protein n=1 Tax=Trichoglossum hirsutum TaxID=265104 RepID=A0A9P8IBX7_9PEZI|nr:hypothetical protein GP486_007351 [Trichoglossum hirsutum]